MRDTPTLTTQRGFTIFEVALAATVLALTLTGMIQVVTSGTEMLDLSRKQTLAAQILRSEVDQLRLQAWPVVSGYPAGSSFLQSVQVGYTGVATATMVTPGNGYPASSTLTSTNDPSFAQFIINYPNFANIYTLTRTVTCVQPAQANPNPGQYPSAPLLLQVTFTISWTGVTGHAYSRTCSTYVSANGLSVAYQRS